MQRRLEIQRPMKTLICDYCRGPQLGHDHELHCPSRRMKTLTDADIVAFYLSFTLPRDPKESERLLNRIKAIADVALLEVWNQ